MSMLSYRAGKNPFPALYLSGKLWREALMKNNFRTYVCFVVLLLFWGNLYPQYALTEDIYTVTDACDRSLKKDPAADYARISAAGAGAVKIRFALIEKLDEWFGEKKTYEDRGN